MVLRRLPRMDAARWRHIRRRIERDQILPEDGGTDIPCGALDPEHQPGLILWYTTVVAHGTARADDLHPGSSPLHMQKEAYF
ncbi:hypothetical protein ASZ90_008999 [hydrocarbon metagenome]|uniref:Uncharacterized protein n=1 Tax=hydrocarbon metagenome TaxID=938273 RepID=A0A0W8FK26_9ZZZZ